jgi:hypothetical protein
MVDLVKQLRDTNDTHPDSLRVMVLWGADEIERLRVVNAELVKAAQKISQTADGIWITMTDDQQSILSAAFAELDVALAKAKEQK